MHIQEYKETAAAIAILRAKYSGPFDVTTAKGMVAARAARAEVKGYRVALEKLRVELKAPALERTRLIDAEAKRITADLLAIEDPIDQQIKAEEQHKEQEKAAQARAEAARLVTITARISAMRNQVAQVANQPAAAIQTALDQAQALELAPEEYQEFMPDAIEALHNTRQALRTALDARLAYEAEQARLKAEQDAAATRIKAEREELERLRTAEAARLQAEREAMERQRAELDAQQRALAEQAEQAKLAQMPHKGKGADPVADLKQAINASPETAKALDDAYQRGYQDGLNNAQHAA